MMADILRFEPAHDSSSSHALKVHIENARHRRAMRTVLEEFQRLSSDEPLAASWFLQWVIDFLRGL